MRDKIYAHLLDTELVNFGQPNVSYTHAIKDSRIRFSASRPPFPVQTALLYVSKQISQEALHFFYSRNLFVRFKIYSADARHAKTMLEESGVLFSVAGEEAVESCISHAMDLSLVEKGSAVKRANVLFPAQYLPRLINFLELASKASGTWAPSHALFISVKNTYGLEKAKVQGDLLELFRMLKNLGKVEIDGGQLQEGYGKGLQKSMTAANFEPDEWLETINDMVNRAEDAKKKQAYDAAAQHAEAAIISMTYGYLTCADALHSQPESFTKAVQRLRWRTELSLASTHYERHAEAFSSSFKDADDKQRATDLLAAEVGASHALSLATDSPSPASNPWFRSLPAELIPPNKADWFTDDERGRSWYVLGLTHFTLSENLFAAGDLERALGLLSHQGTKEKAEQAFEKARMNIDWETRPGLGMRKAIKAAKS